MKNTEIFSQLGKLLDQQNTSSEIEVQREKLFTMAKDGIILPFSMGKESIDVTFQCRYPDTLHIYIGKKEIGLISVINDSDEEDVEKHGIFMKKKIAEPYRNLGIMTVATSIFFEILHGQGYVDVQGEIKESNERSIRSRFNVKVLFGQNSGGTYETQITPSVGGKPSEKSIRTLLNVQHSPEKVSL